MKRKGSVLIASGLALITAALLLTLYNLYDQRRAERTAREAAYELSTLLAETVSSDVPEVGEHDELPDAEIPDYLLNPEMEMPTESVDGVDYVGVLRIPALALELPVISAWSYPNLKIAPCRYTGSAYLDDLTVCAHNYVAHFGGLKNLLDGDEVTFTDMDGNVFAYRVAAVEVLPPTAIEDMTASGWPLTLFTCTVGGRSRVAVRCERAA